MTHTHKENDMSETKSGYEIRANLLVQAQDLLERNLDRKINSVTDYNHNNPESTKTVPARQLKAADVISVASELYAFVEQK